MLQLCSDSIVINLTKSPLPVVKNFSCTRTVPYLSPANAGQRAQT